MPDTAVKSLCILTHSNFMRLGLLFSHFRDEETKALVI